MKGDNKGNFHLIKVIFFEAVFFQLVESYLKLFVSDFNQLILSYPDLKKFLVAN